MSADYIDTYYARTVAAESGPRPALSGEIEAEVCIVGGGLAGLSVALGLAERGVSVALVEARRLGWGASGRNAGFVTPGFSVDAAKLVRRLGRDHARELYGLSHDALALIRQRIDRHGIDCGPLIDGRLMVARRDKPGGFIRQRDFLAETFAHQTEHWPRERVRESLISARYFDGLFDPRAFQFHPLNYALGIAAAAEAAGARLYEGSPATGLAMESGGGRVSTAAGAVRARHVVICCGGYTGRLAPRLAGAIVPVATYVMVTEPLGDRLDGAIRLRCAISDTRRAGDYYRVLADTRLLWGGRMTAVLTEPRRLGQAMRADMAATYPQLADVRVETAWGGHMGYARHQMPQIGRLGEGPWYANGFGGHGMNTTTMAGELIAAAIAEGDDRYKLFAPFGLAPVFGPLGVAAAQATYLWYRLRDRVL